MPLSARFEQDEAAARHQLSRALAVLLGVVVVGTAGFAWVEDWTAWRALFFTLVTITTVGYGDEGISETGEALAAILLIVGIGAASYTFGVVVQTAFTRQLRWRRKMQQQVDRLEGHVIVCGFGRMGQTIAEQLQQAGHSFVVLERDPDMCADARYRGYAVVEGCASDDETLALAGVARAAYLVSAVDSDVENIVVTLTARELNPEIPIVARAERDEDVRKLRRAGATRIVSPFRSGGLEVAHAILRPKVSELLSRAVPGGDEVAIAEVTIEEGSALAGVALSEYGRGEGASICFVALERDGKEPLLSPGGRETLQPGDTLLVVAHAPHLARMREHAQA